MFLTLYSERTKEINDKLGELLEIIYHFKLIMEQNYSYEAVSKVSKKLDELIDEIKKIIREIKGQ